MTMKFRLLSRLLLQLLQSGWKPENSRNVNLVPSYLFLNEQAKEEAFEDYYDQLLKNVVWKKPLFQRFWLFAGNKPKIEFSVSVFQK